MLAIGGDMKIKGSALDIASIILELMEAVSDLIIVLLLLNDE